MAIQKYGKENFKKEILFVFESEEEMNKKEKELVVLSEDSYNLCEGGEGGPIFFGRTHSSVTKEKIREKAKKRKLSLISRMKISEANKNRIITDSFREKMSRPRKPMSEETKRKISQTRKNLSRVREVVISPSS